MMITSSSFLCGSLYAWFLIVGMSLKMTPCAVQYASAEALKMMMIPSVIIIQKGQMRHHHKNSATTPGITIRTFILFVPVLYSDQSFSHVQCFSKSTGILDAGTVPLTIPGWSYHALVCGLPAWCRYGHQLCHHAHTLRTRNPNPMWAAALLSA